MGDSDNPGFWKTVQGGPKALQIFVVIVMILAIAASIIIRAAGGRWPWEYSHSAPISQPPPVNPKQQPLPDNPKQQPQNMTGGPIVDGEPVNIDFQLKNKVSIHGVDCGDPEITFPGASIGKVGEPLNFRYDGSFVCRGQSFRDFSGEIDWTGNEHTAMQRAGDDTFPGIGGTVRVTFSRPGSYNVHARFTAVCLDVGMVGPTCNEAGDTVVTIR